MKKRILGMFLIVMSLFILVACGQEKLDGIYYDYYKTDDNYLISKLYPVVISENKLDDGQGNVYTLNQNSLKLEGNEEIIFYSVDGDVIKFNGNTYVKSDSDKYKELVDNGAEISE